MASKYCEILAHFRLEKTQQLDNKTNLSSSLFSRRISSSSEKRNSEKTCGEVIQNKPATSAILFSFDLARNPRKTHARDRVDWPFSLPFRPVRTQSRTQSLQAFWSTGQRREDSGDIEFYYRRISAVKQRKPLGNSQSKN